MTEFPSYEFMGIEPSLKRDKKLSDFYRKKLKISEPKFDEKGKLKLI